MGFVK